MEVKDRNKLNKLAKQVEKVAGKRVMHDALRRIATCKNPLEAQRLAEEALAEIGDPVVIKITDR
jgi:hypothetical protein